MAKRTSWLHVDLAGLGGDRITETLLEHRDLLRDLGFETPVHSLDEGRRARLEMLRQHREHGLRRKEVEGVWAEICRRAWKGRKTPVLSVPGLGAASPEQVALVLDVAHGLGVHVVATVPTTPTTDQELAVETALASWQVRLKPGRLHRVPAADWEAAWQGFAGLSGLSGLDGPADLSAAARRPRRPSVR